jgi:hypothetical protein
MKLLIKKTRLTKEKYQKKNKKKMKTHRKEKRLMSSSSESIDVHKLLSGLVDQAAHAVGANAVITSSSNSATVENQLNQRSARFLAMPPPNPRALNDPQTDQYQNISSNYLGLELLRKAAAALPIVSPEMSGRMAELHPIPVLRLELSSLNVEAQKESSDKEDISQMSADQCAAIVDSIFGGGVDDSVFHMSPSPTKRARIRS